MKIKLGLSRFTEVDEDDFEHLNQWTWSFDGRYAYRKEWLPPVNGKQKYRKIYMQKAVNKTPEGMDTDHINRDKLDNRKVNLRSASRGENEMNKPKQSGRSSKYRGVCWHAQRGKWKAEIRVKGVRKHLGVFLCEEDAAKAYDAVAMVAFGEFFTPNIQQKERS